MKTDVLLLTDVFEKFRIMCLELLWVRPSALLHVTECCLDAMLLKTGVELERIHDLDMYEMIESGLRGGMCQVSHKHVKANNKYMKSYDENINSSFNTY